MPASGILTSAGNSAHNRAVSGIALFDGVTGPKWRPTKIILQVGPRPSYALVVIPLKELHERAPTIACVKGSPLEQFKHNSTCTITADCGAAGGALVFHGLVVEIHEKFGPERDHAVVEVWDYRHVLSGLVFSGSFWMSGTGGDVVYRQGWRAHFNRNNRPNAILRDVPAFGKCMV